MRPVQRVLPHQALRFSVFDQEVSQQNLAIASVLGESDAIITQSARAVELQRSLRKDSLHAQVPDALLDGRNRAQDAFASGRPEGRKEGQVASEPEICLQILL